MNVNKLDIKTVGDFAMSLPRYLSGITPEEIEAARIAIVGNAESAERFDGDKLAGKVDDIGQRLYTLRYGLEMAITQVQYTSASIGILQVAPNGGFVNIMPPTMTGENIKQTELLKDCLSSLQHLCNGHLKSLVDPDMMYAGAHLTIMGKWSIVAMTRESQLRRQLAAIEEELTIITQ